MRKIHLWVAAAVGALSLVLVPMLARADSAASSRSDYPACCLRAGGALAPAPTTAAAEPAPQMDSSIYQAR